MFHIYLGVAVVAASITTDCAAAQPTQTDLSPSLTAVNMQMQYRETVPPGGDVNQVRAKIFPEATRDCEAIAKAVGRKCVINNINFNNGFFGAQTNQAQGPQVNANANAAFVTESATQ